MYNIQDMKWHIITALAALAISVAMLLIQLLKLITSGKPKDLSKGAGNVSAGVAYSYTKAMSPMEKESAYLHLPTYAAGMIYHAGIFATLLLFLLFISSLFEIPQTISMITGALLIVSGLCGLAVLFKRFINAGLRSLSGADDYISNFLTTLAIFATAAYLLYEQAELPYYLIVSVLLLWIPLGKTRHLLYFFFARYHLGYFFGKRGTWPPKSLK